MNKRSRSVKIYLTPEEYELLYIEAKKLDMSVTNYIYRKATDREISYGRIDV